MKTVLAFLIALMCAVAPAVADDVSTERVKFKPGHSGASVHGAIKGRDAAHYLLGARAGQTMRVELKTKSTSTYFNVFAPGKVPGQDEALFIGDTGGNVFDGTLPANGDYLIQVYLIRSAARRNEKAKFTLDIAIGAGSGASTSEGDALVPGTNFHATGEVPCAREAGQSMEPCAFGVTRHGQGSADVTVFWPDGGNRVIFFEKGEPVGYDESEADGDAKFSYSKNDGSYAITVGDQRFEIFEAVIFGG